MKITKFGSATNDKIKLLENALGIKLPIEYIDFLLKYNGGIIVKDHENEIIIDDTSGKITLDVLFGVDTGNDASDILVWMKELKEDLYENAIVIGDELGQGKIVMIVDGDDKGIYYWDAFNQLEESKDDENTYWIAEDFNEFLKMLDLK